MMIKYKKQTKLAGRMVGAAGLCALLNPVPGQANPPNVVIILADDLGWNAIGYHNPEVKTPNIDRRICAEGVELDQFYVSPMCSPTRAGLMTGRYPIRFGCARSVIPPWRDFGVPVDEVMLPKVLEKAGYDQRGMFGKWHLGHMRTQWLPRQRGFSDFYGCYNGAMDYFTHERDGELDWHKDEQSSYDEGYATDLIGTRAAEFIRTASQTPAPFFCYVAFTAPHEPLQVPAQYKEPYANISGEKLQTYYAMITAMDTQVGRILDAIDATGVAQNTLVWFLSDNGGVASIPNNNFPLNGSKLTVYEGGVRAASCVRFPGRYPAGHKVADQAAFIDVMPTVLSLAGIRPEQAACHPLDGLDLDGLLAGKDNSLPERDLFFYTGQKGEADEQIAIISKGWKLVVHGPSLVNGRTSAHKVELFQLNEDPMESKDVASAYPEMVEGLIKKLIQFRKLQPKNGVPPYKEGHQGFVSPKEWQVGK